MVNGLFITIVGTNHYYGMKPFEIGRIFKLIKEPQNEFDEEAIRAELPFIGKIGYVANSPNTLAKGTLSAGRMYEQFKAECFAVVRFVTFSKVICEVMSSVTEVMEISDLGAFRWEINNEKNINMMVNKINGGYQCH